MKLTFESVSLSFPGFELDLDFETTSDALGIFGPSGAGKTTMLEILAGLRLPDRGRILIDGVDLTAVPPRLRSIGYVPQDETLFPHLSVRGNLAFGMRSRTVQDARPVIDAMASSLDLENLLERSVSGLSGGERRRVAIGRAVLTSPRLILLDEPLSGLDQALGLRMIDLLRTLRETRGIPMVFVSHVRREVSALCQDILVLNRGRIVRRGSPEDVLRVDLQVDGGLTD